MTMLTTLLHSDVTLKIFFEKPSTVFYPEEEIRCSFNVITNVPLKVQCIYVRLRGYGEVKWHQRENKHTRIYHAEETYLNKVIYLWGQKDGPQATLEAGCHQYAMRFQLPRGIPPSFEGDKGHIRYEVKLVMDIKWAPDKTKKDFFYVRSALDLNTLPHLRGPLQKKHDYRVSWCFPWPKRTLTIYTIAPAIGFVPGEEFTVMVVLLNDSMVRVRRVKLILQEVVTFWSQSPIQATRICKRILWEQKFDSTYLKHERHERQRKMFKTSVFLNPSYAFKTVYSSGIVHCEYFLVSKFNIGLCRTLKQKLRLTIGTVPFQGEHTSIPDDILYQVLPTIPHSDSGNGNPAN